MPIQSTSAHHHRPQIHGHRGCRGLLPENTIPAFLLALEIGVDAIELDVVISQDGQVVVSHEPWMSAALCFDPKGNRIDPSQEKSLNLFQLPYSIIRAYNCGLSQPERFPNQQTLAVYKPLLQEAIQAIERHCLHLGRKPVLYSIEIKSSPAGDGIFHPEPAAFATLVLQVVRACGVLNRTTFLSFDKRILQHFHQLDKRFSLSLLVEDERDTESHLLELGFMPTVYGPEFTLLSEQDIDYLHEYAIAVVPWTVNDVFDMLHLITLEVDGITTDYPDKAIQLLNERYP
ncbi:glycerophosphodiester phosphodiesterase family protein [Hymenobacter sp. BT491]|uniref:glycerophosphodiester phosphodiesterase family protein n=1 Tax=Hymenobacter sp. BT491 TaxID=2766779 RepID=UPI001653C58F|nr:glycerophosphodiester phosphodiesterase family protein [Hymenobacter sp. BT491]MBC6991751.1 glycerophosphodiester phosphodiesterase [Hymenobacter sp. BT491]